MLRQLLLFFIHGVEASCAARVGGGCIALATRRSVTNIQSWQSAAHVQAVRATCALCIDVGTCPSPPRVANAAGCSNHPRPSSAAPRPPVAHQITRRIAQRSLQCTITVAQRVNGLSAGVGGDGLICFEEDDDGT